VGLVVGFGSNFLNVIYSENKLILNNGNHRAIALRQMGITHAPCIVQEASRREDLKLIAGGRLRRDPDSYLKALRPPLLRDFFDERLTTRLQLMRKSRFVRVNFSVEEINLSVGRDRTGTLSSSSGPPRRATHITHCRRG
jgi:hypothetical protein